MNDETMTALLAPRKDDVIEFAMEQLTKYQPRNDYSELLELTIIFLGGTPPGGINFHYPGAIHRARWMAKAIYALKMWLFRNEYPMHQRSMSSRGSSHCQRVWIHLKRVSLFVTLIYVKYWFQTPSSVAAPRNDLTLLQELSVYHDQVV